MQNNKIGIKLFQLDTLYYNGAVKRFFLLFSYFWQASTCLINAIRHSKAFHTIGPLDGAGDLANSQFKGIWYNSKFDAVNCF